MSNFDDPKENDELFEKVLENLFPDPQDSVPRGNLSGTKPTEK
ncbi:MAG: hypothetical protein ACRC3I_11860 [Cetobacterium sp.]